MSAMYSLVNQSRREKEGIQSTSLITTLGGASERCPYSRSVVIPEVPLYVLQWDGTLLWAWKFCRYSRIVVLSAVIISEVDCTGNKSTSRKFLHEVCTKLPRMLNLLNTRA